MSPVVGSDVAAGRRQERKAQNREKLMAAARKVFAEKGLGAATARDIVRETDLATGTFYNYFQDKDEIFRALLEEVTARTRLAVREQRQELDLPVEERVENAFRAYFELAVEERELFDVLRRNAGMVAADEGLFESGIKDLFEDLTTWAEAGELPRIDLDYLASAGAGLGFQVATHLIERDPPDVEGATKFCTRFFLGGVRALAD